MQYVIYIVGFFAFVLGYLRYRRPVRGKFEYHERFRSIRILEHGIEPVKDRIEFQLRK